MKHTNPVKTDVSVAIYARYSSVKQNDTSLDDQIRRCKALALQKLSIRDVTQVYTDAALSGNDDDMGKRDGYAQMLADWRAGKFQVLVVDKFSRLSRDGLEQARLQQLLESNAKRRLITADGTDTINPDWQLPLGFKGMMAQQEVRNLRFRTSRGMVGQLERGFMIATAPYGYSNQKQFDSKQNSLGTKWLIKADEAETVQKIFDMRANGQSMHQIASWLNTHGVPTRRKARTADGGYLRPSAVKSLLQNTIYKGIFIWHGSTAYKKTMRDRQAEVETTTYLREELRLVSDEVWEICNQNRVSRSGYGGGKHAFSSLISCGFCARPMNVTAKFKTRSIYCTECMVAKCTDDQAQRLTSTVSVVGVHEVFKMALHSFMTPEFVDAFRQSLKLRLTGGAQDELKECEERLRKLRSAQEKLSRLIAGSDDSDEMLEARYQEGRQRLSQVQAKYEQLQAGLNTVNESAVKAQMQARPQDFLDSLLNGGLPPEQLRAILSRLFPVVVFEGKKATHTSIFRLQFAMGAAFSAATKGSGEIVNAVYEARFELQYHPSTKGGKKPYWSSFMLGRPVVLGQKAIS